MSDEPERIAKFLARAGIASRREIERMIEAGRITLNGAKLKTPAVKVSATDKIIVDGKPVGGKPETRVWLYHKPVGLVTTERDEMGRKTVFDALPKNLGRVLSVGRLDLNSEGLLLLTNDGALKRALELPATGWLRRYRVRVHGLTTEEALKPLRDGITVEGERFQPMHAELDRQQGRNTWISIGLREGKNREIRRAFKALGCDVNRLIRVSYGPFQLGELERGQVKPIPRRVIKDQLPQALQDEIYPTTGQAKA